MRNTGITIVLTAMLLGGSGLAAAQATPGKPAAPAATTASAPPTAQGSGQGNSPSTTKDASKDASDSADPAASRNEGRAPRQKISTPPTGKEININAASKEELKKLPGGSDEEAAKIIAGRPYKSKAFLVENKIIPMGRYMEIKKLIVAGESPKKSTSATKDSTATKTSTVAKPSPSATKDATPAPKESTAAPKASTAAPAVTK